MDEEYRKEIANRILSRAETNIYFIDDFLYNHSAKDGAYFRSLSILLSYSFELALKAVLVLKNNYSNKEGLEKHLKNLSHNLLKIRDELSTDELEEIGVKNIESRNTTNFIGYRTKTTDSKEIIIENFTDVRYDFTNDSLRDLPEDRDFREWVHETLKLIKNIRESFY